MDLLDKIIAHKRVEVDERKRAFPVDNFENSKLYSRLTYSMKESLTAKHSSGIIAEFKKKSPSAGEINQAVAVEQVSTGYVRAGVAALSIITDSQFFGGSDDDLRTARKLNKCPILRKDFIIDEYQMAESKAMGADAILLIAAVLRPGQIRLFVTKAHELGLEVLLEVHEEVELIPNLESGADLIGINNRNLKTMETDLAASIRMAGLIPDSFVKISESGIISPGQVIELRKIGFSGFLIGEYFMRQPDPALAAADFINVCRELSKQR